MKILALERPSPGAADRSVPPVLLRQEAAKVWELYRSNVVREIYFRADRHEAVLILECRDEKEALAQLAQLPLVGAGLIEFEVIPLTPYPGFERLFDRD